MGQPPAEAVPRQQQATQWGERLARLGLVVVVTLLAVAVLVGYQRFHEISATPERLPDAGEVRLFFNRPGVPALLQATVTSTAFEENEFDYFIRIRNGSGTDPVSFALVNTGAVRPSEEPMYVGGPAHQRNECPWGVWVVPQKGSTCASVRVDKNSLPLNSRPVNAQLTSGRIQRNESGAGFATVHATADVSVSTSAGKRTYFRLPAIGTTYLPPTGGTSRSTSAQTGSYLSQLNSM
jgi:hypothetical protein